MKKTGSSLLLVNEILRLSEGSENCKNKVIYSTAASDPVRRVNELAGRTLRCFTVEETLRKMFRLNR